jgi:hypothetical protein
MSGNPFPVLAGSTYEASVYVGNHRNASVNVYLAFYDSAGTLLSSPFGSNCVDGAGYGGAYLVGYCRTGLITVAPAGAVTAGWNLRATHYGTSPAGDGPFMFFTRAYFGEATPGQSALTPWGAAGATIITPGLIQADAITSDKIAAGTITASDIASGTITATQIAASTITASQIAASTITGGNIAGSTITGGNIAASTITAGNLSVSTLSAITANLGTVTAGTISGLTITGGSIDTAAGNVTLDSNGLTLADWASDNRQAVKWAGGASIFGFGNVLALRAGGSAGINVYAGIIEVYGSSIYSSSAGLELLVYGGGGNRYMCADNDGHIYASGGGC